MYPLLHEQVPTCAFRFTYNRSSKCKSQKVHAPFWVGRARCRTGDCPVAVSMYIDKKPKLGARVPIRAVVYGQCNHYGQQDDDDATDQLPNRRFLVGSQRRATADHLLTSQQPATEYYHARLAEMTDAECQTGNMTSCQTPHVLRQAVYEKKQQSQLHHDVVLDVDLQRRCWLAALPGLHVSGFVQALGIFPFFVTFYTEMQVIAFIRSCKEESGGMLHFDSTGSIVRRLPQQSAPFLYCGLMGKQNLPAFEFITSRHDADWLSSLIQLFLRDVRLANGGRPVTLRHIITDFSYAIIHAVLSAFNNMTLLTYVQTTYSVLLRRCTAERIQSLTFITLCAAHSMKALSRRLVRKEDNKKKRQVVLQLFALLQRSSSLDQAHRLYRNIYVVLCSPNATSVVATSLEELSPAVSTDLLADEAAHAQADEHAFKECQTTDALSLKKSSPFSASFALAIEDVDIGEGADDAPSNSNYSPMGFDCIRDIIHLYPLWSCAMQNDVVRHASDMQECDDVDVSEDVSWPACPTNAKVESHFKSVKHGRLAGRMPVRPREFILAELTNVMGKVNESKLPKQGKRTRRHARTGRDAEEIWKRRRQNRTTYSAKRKATERMAGLQSEAYTVLHDNDQEMTDVAIDESMLLLHQEYPEIGGLEPVGLGLCQKRSAAAPGSLPRFSAATKPFLQILNIGDHWICVTNVFSSEPNEVYIYDSVFHTVSPNAVLQLSSILRQHTERDTITVHVRNFDNQPHRSRLCGFYAVAAALSISNGIDPSGNRYDVDSLASCVSVAVNNKCTDVIVPQSAVAAADITVAVKPKLHCICHSASNKAAMVQCSRCHNQYHSGCVVVNDGAVERWVGPCCRHRRHTKLPADEESEYNTTT